MFRQSNAALAYDRAPTRTVDLDGRLHVAAAPISVARVCDYLGSEIPGWSELGLIPSKLYALLRPAAELERAASSFNNLPVLGGAHVAVTADNPRPDLVCGSTGTDATWDGRYIRVSVVLWTKDAIDGVESGRCADLSAAYRFRCVLDPGTFEGTRFVGRMVDLNGSHVALVPEGRNGRDVSIIGDARLAVASYATRFPGVTERLKAY
jgi:hypothetical protein